MASREDFEKAREAAISCLWAVTKLRKHVEAWQSVLPPGGARGASREELEKCGVGGPPQAISEAFCDLGIALEEADKALLPLAPELIDIATELIGANGRAEETREKARSFHQLAHQCARDMWFAGCQGFANGLRRLDARWKVIYGQQPPLKNLYEFSPDEILTVGEVLLRISEVDVPANPDEILARIDRELGRAVRSTVTGEETAATIPYSFPPTTWQALAVIAESPGPIRGLDVYSRLQTILNQVLNEGTVTRHALPRLKSSGLLDNDRTHGYSITEGGKAALQAYGKTAAGRVTLRAIVGGA